METNYWGTYNTCKALIKYFREKNNGTIINCTSVIGLVPRTYGVAYSSSKHAIEGLTSVLWLETQNFNCRVMAVEPGLFPSNIAKNKKFFVSQFKEYIFPNNQIINLERNYKNDLSCGVNSIIDTVENEKIPRRLLLGKDCIQRVKYEIKMIQDNIKYSKSISNKIARTENNKRYTVINDISFNLKKILYFFNYIRCFILEKIGKKEKRSHYNQKKEILKNKFVKTWIKK